MKQKPRTIPEKLIGDAAVLALITQWKNCHARHRVCRRRIYWGKRNASILEKKRRREKWELVARVLEIERTLIRWIGKATHHPEIWSNRAKDEQSLLYIFEKRYIANRYSTHHLKGKARQFKMKERERIVAHIRDIVREWMLLICKAYDVMPPGPLPLHKRELHPRKLKSASKRLTQEVA